MMVKCNASVSSREDSVTTLSKGPEVHLVMVIVDMKCVNQMVWCLEGI